MRANILLIIIMDTNETKGDPSGIGDPGDRGGGNPNEDNSQLKKSNNRNRRNKDKPAKKEEG